MSRFAARAHRAARVHQPDDLHLVLFAVGQGRYAIDIMRIRQVLRAITPVPLPDAPPFVEGVVELRRAILPVIDLRRRFGLPPEPRTRQGRLLVVTLDIAGRRMVVALGVDRVIEPVRLPKSEHRPRPSLGDNRFFSGVVRHQEQIYLVLDLDALLTSTDEVALAASSGAPPTLLGDRMLP